MTDDMESHDQLHEREQLMASLPMPVPSLGEDVYLAEREAALALNPRCRENFAKYRAYQRSGADLDFIPVKLDIENVSRCNFSCTMCIVSDWPKQQRARDMTVDEFRRLIAEQYGLVEIKLQGVGEPTMAGDALFEMIEIARERRIWVRTTTNASLLHLKNNCEKLIDTGVCEVQISIDGADAETYSTIRKGGDFDRVVANCKQFNDHARRRGREIGKMWVVVQKENLHQLTDLVSLAAKLGFQQLVFSLELSDWGDDGWRDRLAECNADRELNLGELHSLVEQGAELGVGVAFWRVREKYRTDDTAMLCPWPFERSYISSEGRVAPCCYVGNPDTFEIGAGTLGDGGFSEIWNGADYRNFRHSHLTGNPPEFCRGCYSGCGRKA